MALKGLFFPEATLKDKKTILISSIEHSATYFCASALAPLGVKTKLIKPSKEGLIDEASLSDKLCDDCALVSLFLVQNEIGTINPIKKLAQVAKKKGVLFHCDAAQALGRVKIDVQEIPVDMMSLSSHKVYGPKGIGCLYVRRSAMKFICPLIHGGGQEWFKRAGTSNTPAIVGMGEAFYLASLNFFEEDKRIKSLRDQLLGNLRVLEGIMVNGTLNERVSGNLNVSFEGIDAEELLLNLFESLALSTGSACKASLPNGFSVLKELEVSDELRSASVRFGLGRFTTAEEITIASELIVKQVKWLRERS